MPDTATITITSATAATAFAISKPLASLAGNFLEKHLDKPFEVASAILSDQMGMWQWQNRLRILAKAQKIVEQRGEAARQIAPSFLLPLLEKCGNIGSDDLETLWANLLANAVNESSAEHPAYLETLTQLSATEARILELLAASEDTWEYFGSHQASRVANLTGTTEEAVPTSFANLQRLGLIATNGAIFTVFGVEFLRSCGLTVRSNPTDPWGRIVDNEDLTEMEMRMRREIEAAGLEVEKKLKSHVITFS